MASFVVLDLDFVGSGSERSPDGTGEWSLIPPLVDQQHAIDVETNPVVAGDCEVVGVGDWREGAVCYACWWRRVGALGWEGGCVEVIG